MTDQPSRRSGGQSATGLAVRIGRRLLFADAPDFESTIADALGSIGEAVEADCCSLFLIEPECDRIELKHLWNRPGLPPNNAGSLGTDAGLEYPWLLSRLRDKESVRLSKLGELPEQAWRDRKSLKARSVRALLMVPLFLENQPLGAVSVSTVEQHRVWSRQDLRLIESVRDPLIHALLRYRAEQRSIVTERHYRNLIEHSQGIVFSFDRDGRYTYLSPSVTALTGYNRDEVLGRRFGEFVHPDDARRLVPEVRRSLRNNRATPPLEYRVRARDGSFLWHRAVMAPVRDSAGRLDSIVASALDISDLHRESDLRRLLIHLATRFINLPIDQYDAGIHSGLAHIGYFVGADRTYVFDYELAEDRARNTHEWCVEGVAPAIGQLQAIPISEMADLFRSHQAGQPVYIESVADYPDKRLRRRLEDQGVQSLLTVPLMRDNECQGFIGFDWVRQQRGYSDADIELLKVFGGILMSLRLRCDVQNRLSNTALRLRQIVDGTHAGTWEWNPITRQAFFNRRFARMLGHASTDEVPNDSLEWVARIHPDDIEAASVILTEHLRGRIERLECDIRVRHREGHWVWLSIRGQVAERRPNGRAELISGIALDITDRKAADARLKESEYRFRHLLEDVPGIALMGFDRNFNIRFWNRSSEKLYGWSAPEVMHRCFLEFMVPDDQRQTYRCQIEELIQGRRQHWSGELKLLDRDGETVDVFASHMVQTDTEGRLDLFRIDIDQREKKIALDRMQLVAKVFDHSHEGIMITAADGNIVEVNEAFTRITGYLREEAIGRNPRFLQSGRQGPAFYRAMWRTLQQQGYWSGEVWNRRKDGEFYAEQLTISRINDHAGNALRYVGLFSDITSSKEYQQNLERIAHYDPLTELPNRALLNDRLSRAMARAARRGKALLVACIDIDQFKSINDRFGHRFGDECLRQTAQRLREATRSCDTVARLGGDEFVLVIADMPSKNAATRFLQRLLETVSRRFRIEERESELTFSVGATAYPQNRALEADQLLRQADQAMYEAKKRGRDQICLFDADLEASHLRNLELLDQMRTALQEEQFQIWYQPKVNLFTGAILGMEALIRWQHPDRGLLAPSEFLPILETDELAHDVGHWVIGRALRDRTAWRDLAPGLDISVNVSAQQLLRPGFAGALRLQLDDYDSECTKALTLEFLETGILEDIDRGAEVTRACQRLGVGFALDDFGTGFSSLSHLKHLPLTQIKIDRSFVSGMLSSPDDLSIIEGVINLARVFDVEVLAEGVETIQQARALMHLGCSNVQGYLVGRPMPSDQISGWIEDWKGIDQLASVEPLDTERTPILFGQAELAAVIKHLNAFRADTKGNVPSLNSHSRFQRWLNLDRHDDPQGRVDRLREAYQALAQERRQFNDSIAGDDRSAALGLAECLESRARTLTEQLQALL